MHKSVLLNECLEYLNLKDTSVIVDCTLGYAGHSSEILKRISKGFLYTFDQDGEAITFSEQKLSSIRDNYEIIRSNFVNLKTELDKRKTEIDGILYDLGVSSPQLDEDTRGFSFHKSALLDMRMDTDSELDASKVVNEYSFSDLKRIIRDYGEENYAVNIARKIVLYREKKKIETTDELVDIIKSSVPEKYKKLTHPARRTFMAIRIEVNKELDVFSSSLKQALELISIGGRICVITFHSLEDRICKNIFKEATSIDKSLSKLPLIPEHLMPKFELIANIIPSDDEIRSNNRSRSARLRVIERIR